MQVDYEASRQVLRKCMASAQSALLNNKPPSVPANFQQTCNSLFSSSTQAYREVLLGCIVARIQNKEINICQPYISQGPYAFSGRSVDENVVNPFLQEHRIPCSRGPYLSVFRRSVELRQSIRDGLRDRAGYDALLVALQDAHSATSDNQLMRYLSYLLYRFLLLREEANIPLSRLQRISLTQYDILIGRLLDTPSGGRFPVILVEATMKTIKEFFGLDWIITVQGINVADSASSAGGDITIKSGGKVVLAAEVTERPITKSRILTTFNTKIAPSGIDEYLFFVKLSGVSDEARQQARQYFAQGHELNFLEIKHWIIMSLATMGANGRTIFNQNLLMALEDQATPRTLRVAWNTEIEALTEASSVL